MNTLFPIFAAICIASVYVAAETALVLHPDVIECSTKHNVNSTELNKWRTHRKLDPTRDMQCFSACLMKNRNLMDENGKWNTKVLEDSNIGKECKEYAKDECETAAKLLTCILEIQLAESVLEDNL